MIYNLKNKIDIKKKIIMTYLYVPHIIFNGKKLTVFKAKIDIIKIY